MIKNPIPWPNGARCACAITFDMDADSLIHISNPKDGHDRLYPVTMGRYGPTVAVPRILETYRKFGLKQSFFIPAWCVEQYPAAVDAILEGGHEIGHHGWTHVPPNDMTREQEEAGLVRANEQIRKLTGQYARGYRSPSWDLSPHSVELLLKHGFVYDSSMMGDDYTPYRVRQGDIIKVDQPAVWGKPCKLVEMPISWSLDDYPAFEFIRTKEWILPGLRNYNAVLSNWLDDFNYMTRAVKWGVITYTFHPFVIGRGGRMLMLEKLIRKLKDGGAVFTTLEDAAAEYAKRVPFKG